MYVLYSKKQTYVLFISVYLFKIAFYWYICKQYHLTFCFWEKERKPNPLLHVCNFLGTVTISDCHVSHTVGKLWYEYFPTVCDTWRLRWSMFANNVVVFRHWWGATTPQLTVISVMATIMDVLRAALRDNAFEAISIQLVSVLSMP